MRTKTQEPTIGRREILGSLTAAAAGATFLQEHSIAAPDVADRTTSIRITKLIPTISKE